MGRIKTSIYFTISAIAAPYIYDRYVSLSNLLANKPGKLQHVNNFKSHEFKFEDRIRNCEDVILEESLGIAFLSCDPGRDRWNTVMGSFHPPASTRADHDNGRIWIYDYSTPDLSDSAAMKPLIITNSLTMPADLHPLGIEFDGATSTLYVINHSRNSGSVIEVFQVSIKESTAQHIKTFKHPLILAPNSIELLGDGKMYVTNDHYLRARVSPLLSKIETFSGAPGGTVVYTDLHNPQDTKVMARVPFANGIARLNSSTLAVASSSKPGVYFYTINADHSLTFRKMMRTPAGVDNISVDSNGKLLLAGHPFVPALTKVVQGRAGCNEHGSEEEKAKCVCTAPSWAAEWSEEGGLKELLKDGAEGGNGICSSSTIVRDVGRGVGMVSMLYGKGLVVFQA